jgi:hypothetical protein
MLADFLPEQLSFLYLGLDKYIQIHRLDVHDDTFDKIREERFEL